MPTNPPEGTPWWAWLIYGVLVIGLPTIIVAIIQQWRRVDEIRDQVKNTHSTNLRADIDETKAEATLAKESSHRTERLTQDLIKSLRAIEHSIDRHEKLRAEFEAESRADRELLHRELSAKRDARPNA